MSIHLPEAEENPKRTILEEMAMWKSSLLSVALHVFVIGGLAKSVVDLPNSSSATPPIHETQKVHHRKVDEILAEVDKVQEKISEVREAKAKRVNELINLYLDPQSNNYTEGLPPVEAYLELDGYDSVEHWLKYLPTEESAQKDWHFELEKRKNAWLKRYEAALQKIVQADLPWTGDVEKDFPLLQKALYLREGAFFAQDERPVRYAFKANTAHEQLELAQVNCTSSRFTPWVLEAVYKSRNLSMEPLKNLKTIQWADHIASFYDEGPGTQLQEMETDTPLQGGRLSPENQNEGTVSDNKLHFADYIRYSDGIQPEQARRLDALGYEVPSLKYGVKDPPALAALEKQKKVPSEAEGNDTDLGYFTEDDIRYTVSPAKLFSGKTVGRGHTVLEPPEWLKNPRMREIVIQKMRRVGRLGRNHLNVNGVNLAIFGDLELFSPKEAETLVNELLEDYPGGLQRLFIYFTLERSYKIPNTLLERMIQDPDTLNALSDMVQSELTEEQIGELDGPSSTQHLLTLLQQFKSARTMALLLNPKTPLPELKTPEDAEDRLRGKLFRWKQESLKKELDLDISTEEFDFKNSNVDWKKVVEKYQNSPDKLKDLLDKSPDLRSELGPIILSIQSEELRNFLKPFYLEAFQHNSKVDFVTEEPLASWAKEVLSERRAKGTISDMDLYYSGWGVIIPAGDEKLDIDEYFSRPYSMLLSSYDSPSPEFITRMQAYYMNSETEERVKLLQGLAHKNLFILPGEALYPEDQEWITSTNEPEGNLLRFHYAAKYDLSALKNTELQEVDQIDSRNLKWAGTPWDRLAGAWEEVARRTQH